MTNEFSATNNNPASGDAPVSDRTLALLDDLERRWAGLPKTEPLGPGVHDMTRPMSSLELSRWLVMRGVEAEDLDGYLLQYAGKTRAEMDNIYDSLHGSMA